MITEKHRFMLFGTYPSSSMAPALVCQLLFVGLLVAAACAFWNWTLT